MSNSYDYLMDIYQKIKEFKFLLPKSITEYYLKSSNFSHNIFEFYTKSNFSKITLKIDFSR